jgi:hypothetical protein
MYWSSAEFSSWFQLKGKSRKNFWYHNIYKICSFFDFGFEGLGGCSPTAPPPLGCAPDIPEGLNLQQYRFQKVKSRRWLRSWLNEGLNGWTEGYLSTRPAGWSTDYQFYVIHFRAYVQYNKKNPTYAQYCLLMYLLFIFSPTCFGK